MKKQIQILAWIAALVLLLCACSTPDGNPSNPDSSSPPAQSEIQPIPSETVSAIAAKSDSIVSEMYHDVYTNSEGKEYLCSIPQINLDSEEVSALNDTIHQTFLANGAVYNSEYRYYEVGDLLTVMIVVHQEADSYPEEYYIYTIRTSDGHVLTRAEVIEAAGMNEAEFDKAASTAMGHAYCNFSGAVFGQFTDEFVQRQFSNTIGAENVAQAVPYFEEDGTLSVRAYIYQLAGSTYHEELVPLENYTLSELYDELLNAQ